MIGVDFRNTSMHFTKGLSQDKQLERDIEKSKKLSCHMQQHGGRLSLGEVGTYNTLRANKFANSNFLDPKTTLNSRKDFHVDPNKIRQARTQKVIDGDKPKKKNLTFNQLLQKYGYI